MPGADEPLAHKLSLEETARAIVAANEDMSEWDLVVYDGLSDMPWEESSILKDTSSEDL